MRILFVNPVGSLGGAERSLLDMMRALRDADQELELHLLLLAPGPLEALARALGVEVEVLALPVRLRGMGEASLTPRGVARLLFGRVAFAREGLAREGVAFARRFRRSVARVRPDLVHTNGMKAHLLAGLLSRDLPGVLHVRDFLTERRFSRRLFALLHRPRLLVVANSQAVARDMATQMPRVTVRTVYNAIDLLHFAPGPGDRAWLAGLAGAAPPPAHAVCFGMVATYARWKGQALFLQAAAHLVREHPELLVRFYIVGGPVYSTNGSQFELGELLLLRRQLGLEEHVGFVPFQADVAPVYRALDVLVNPSTRPEPFGRSIVEAMATRCSVIVANNGGALELFSDGVTALGFETGDAVALAQQMARLAGSAELRSRLAGAAYAQVAERFALPRLGAEIAQVYAEVLAQPGRGGREQVDLRRGS